MHVQIHTHSPTYYHMLMCIDYYQHIMLHRHSTQGERHGGICTHVCPTQIHTDNPRGVCRTRTHVCKNIYTHTDIYIYTHIHTNYTILMVYTQITRVHVHTHTSTWCTHIYTNIAHFNPHTHGVHTDYTFWYMHNASPWRIHCIHTQILHTNLCYTDGIYTETDTGTCTHTSTPMVYAAHTPTRHQGTEVTAFCTCDSSKLQISSEPPGPEGFAWPQAVEPTLHRALRRDQAAQGPGVPPTWAAAGLWSLPGERALSPVGPAWAGQAAACDL